MTNIEAIERVAIKTFPSFDCAGVNWGIRHLKDLLEEHGTVYIPNKNGLVHNNYVTQELADLGAVFVDSADQVPSGSVVANSMHGRSIEDTKVFMDQKTLHYDLTCPLVETGRTRFIRAINEAKKQGKVAKLFYVCKNTTHPEPKSFIEQVPNHIIPVVEESDIADYQPLPDEVYYMDSQTTINTVKAMELIEKYRTKFPDIKRAPQLDGCFATYNRQQSLQKLLEGGVDKIVVFGSSSSSNTTELVKITKSSGTPVEFLERARNMRYSMFAEFNRIGIHGGASVPGHEGDEAMEIFVRWGYRPEYLNIAEEPSDFISTPRSYNYRNGATDQKFIPLITVY